MTRSSIIAAAIASALIAFGATSWGATAHAQIGNSELPVEITAEHAEALDNEKRLMYVGNVRATQGDSSILADRMDVYFSGNGGGEGVSGWGDIERIEATGNVFYSTPTQRARGDLGIYLLAEETVTLTGDVVITQGENTITTNRFQTDLETGDSTFGDDEGSERVRMVLFPQGGGETEGEDTPSEDTDEDSSR